MLIVIDIPANIETKYKRKLREKMECLFQIFDFENEQWAEKLS